MVDQGSPSQEIPDPPSSGRMLYVGLTKAEQRGAADLIQRLLDLVDDGHLAADAPTDAWSHGHHGNHDHGHPE